MFRPKSIFLCQMVLKFLVGSYFRTLMWIPTSSLVSPKSYTWLIFLLNTVSCCFKPTMALILLKRIRAVSCEEIHNLSVDLDHKSLACFSLAIFDDILVTCWRMLSPAEIESPKRFYCDRKLVLCELKRSSTESCRSFLK